MNTCQVATNDATVALTSAVALYWRVRCDALAEKSADAELDAMLPSGAAVVRGDWDES